MPLGSARRPSCVSLPPHVRPSALGRLPTTLGLSVPTDLGNLVSLQK